GDRLSPKTGTARAYSHQLFVLALWAYQPGSAAQAIHNRWFAPPVEFCACSWRKTPQKKPSFSPFPFSGRGPGGIGYHLKLAPPAHILTSSSFSLFGLTSLVLPLKS
ncbi:MAG: hypothetical protein NTW32_01960, partial [Chloroflexi bacterium]|nr:hypothetical protein [Chloroflexota bacterium]